MAGQLYSSSGGERLEIAPDLRRPGAPQSLPSQTDSWPGIQMTWKSLKAAAIYGTGYKIPYKQGGERRNGRRRLLRNVQNVTATESGLEILRQCAKTYTMTVWAL